MSGVTAVLIDTASIQHYVFASNKLRANIGASRIVRGIYGEQLQRTISGVLGKDVRLDEWREPPSALQMSDPTVDFEVGYIGGGNALLFFRDAAAARKTIRSWTRTLLLEAPGVRTAFAVKDDMALDDFQLVISDLFKQLEANKNKFVPQTVLSKHGITADCPLTGATADIFEPRLGRHVSAEAFAKLQESRGDEEEWLAETGDAYCFTEDLDQLGQERGDENHIAIVHIDGNGMGQHFRECQTLAATRMLSHRVDLVMKKTFQDLVTYVVDCMGFFLKESGFKIHHRDGRAILPLRPILVAGDDATFVCDGRLGVHLAEKYLQCLEKNSAGDFTACAGIAIIKTKYPFFRGYTLAEELCRQAKKKARLNPGTSWLDFHLLYGGLSDPLESMRERSYRTGAGERLIYGPYLVTGRAGDGHPLRDLKEGIRVFNDPEKWPRSKVMELRSNLSLGQGAASVFLREMKARGAIPYLIPGRVTTWMDSWMASRHISR